MTLIVEDGTGVTGANSYDSVANYIAYGALYGVTIANDAQAETDMRKAMDYLESRILKGVQKYPLLDTHFPATALYINDVLQSDTMVPKLAIRAQKEIALSIRMGLDPLAIVQNKIKAESFAGESITYGDNVDVNPRIDLYLSALLVDQDLDGLRFKVQAGGTGKQFGIRDNGTFDDGTPANLGYLNGEF